MSEWRDKLLEAINNDTLLNEIYKPSCELEKLIHDVITKYEVEQEYNLSGTHRRRFIYVEVLKLLVGRYCLNDYVKFE